MPTTVEMAVGFTVATVLGIALAVAITFSAWVREALYPNLVTLQLIPKVAVALLFIIWLGAAGDTSDLPKRVKSQLCTLVDTPPRGPEWLHEIKYDGYRMHARLDRGRAQLLTRTGLV